LSRERTLCVLLETIATDRGIAFGNIFKNLLAIPTARVDYPSIAKQ
jgi:hypothetical protein